MNSFVNDMRNNISVNNLCPVDDKTVSFTCFYNEKETVEKLLSGRNGVVRKYAEYGLPVILHRLKKHPGLCAGLILSVCVITFSTLLVWDVRVEGNEKLSEEEIEIMLMKAGLYEGMFKKSADVKSIVNKVLIREDELSWLSVNFDGTVAHVEVKEAKIGKLAEKKENVNLVASHNGIILRSDVLEGQSKVNKGDAVEKGHLLVSAFVDKKTGGSLLRGARGFVWAQTQRKYRVIVPLEVVDKSYTGKSVDSVEISVLGHNFSLEYPLFCSFESFERRKENKERSFAPDRYLPFELSFVKKLEYKEKNIKRTQQEAVELAREICRERLFVKSPNFKMSSFSEKHELSGENLVYECVFSGVENIAKKMEFELS